MPSPFLPAFLLFLFLPLAGPAADETHLLRIGDTLQLEVFGEPDLGVTKPVMKNGTAAFKLIGPVKVLGKTVAEATKEIRDAYEKDYLVDPKLTLSVVSYAEQKVFVSGAVAQAAELSAPEGGKLDLATALASCGGISVEGDPSRVTVVRANGTRVVHDLSGENKGENILLGGGDRVIVGVNPNLRETFLVIGEVRRPGLQGFPVDGEMDLVTALAQAGGYTELGNPKKVSVNRKGKVIRVNAKELAEEGARQFLIQPDDVITVPERFW